MTEKKERNSIRSTRDGRDDEKKGIARLRVCILPIATSGISKEDQKCSEQDKRNTARVDSSQASSPNAILGHLSVLAQSVTTRR
jgi:hypothetical protein